MGKVAARALLAVLLLSLFTMAAPADVAWWQDGDGGGPLDVRKMDAWGGSRLDWRKGFLEVVAYGAADPRVARNQAHAEILALKAARYLAFEKLLEAVKGVRLNSRTLLRNAVIADGRLMVRVTGVVRGARVVAESLTQKADGSVMATVRLAVPLATAKGLAGATLPRVRPRAEPPPFRPYVPPAPRPAALRPPYSGLIVVAKGLNAGPALFPRIVENRSRRVIYGPSVADPNFALKRGVVGYASSVAQAKRSPRTGPRPLVVKAVRAEGLGKSKLVISYDDAVKIYAADLRSGFLSQCRVTIVIN